MLFGDAGVVSPAARCSRRPSPLQALLVQQQQHGSSMSVFSTLQQVQATRAGFLGGCGRMRPLCCSSSSTQGMGLCAVRFFATNRIV